MARPKHFRRPKEQLKKSLPTGLPTDVSTQPIRPTTSPLDIPAGIPARQPDWSPSEGMMWTPSRQREPNPQVVTTRPQTGPRSRDSVSPTGSPPRRSWNRDSTQDRPLCRIYKDFHTFYGDIIHANFGPSGFRRAMKQENVYRVQEMIKDEMFAALAEDNERSMDKVLTIKKDFAKFYTTVIKEEAPLETESIAFIVDVMNPVRVYNLQEKAKYIIAQYVDQNGAEST